MNDKERKKLLQFQKSEMTEHRIYKYLSGICRDEKNQAVLARIADQEAGHYEYFRKITGVEVRPRWGSVVLYVLIARVLGLTFGLKLMERAESQSQSDYGVLVPLLPEIEKIQEDEERHEKEVLGMIEEEKLRYIGSAVLGLNDALVELTGALAGLTLALQSKQLVAVAGLITGIAASFSMAASEYLSTKAEPNGKSPLKACFYTGLAYILTVFVLIVPFLIPGSIYFSLAFSLVNAILVILFFTFYTSVAQGLDFGKRFREMLFVSLGVAALSFFVGLLVRRFFNIDV